MQIYPNFIFNSNKYHSLSFSAKRKEDIKVSVILPIYNQQKYLKKALKSLQRQTLKDTEFICVNDGSTDKSLSILRTLRDNDKRVKIINQKNKGSGPARNIGLKKAKGKYIAFLDPDDWFEKDALKTAYQKAEKQKSDMVVFNYNCVDEKTKKVTSGLHVGSRIRKVFPNFHTSRNFDWHDIEPRVFLTLLLMSWNKLIRRDLIQNKHLRFSNCSLSEDNVFVFGAILNAQKIGYVKKRMYNYLQRQTSAVHTTTDKNLCVFQAIEDVKKLIAKMGLTEQLSAQFDDFVVKILELNAKRIKSQKKLQKMCERHLSEKQYELLKEKNIVD